MSIDVTHTLKMAGYPDTVLKVYDHWVVLLRPKQPTLGSMLLVVRGDIRRLPDIPLEGFSELYRITGDMERALQKTVGFDKMNYIQLGMIDPQIHFHVIPRHEKPKQFAGGSFADAAWPKPPNIGDALDLSPAQFEELKETLKAALG
jgi:diadenosine tetraphosphate (Ap4A) HIT family hydrolase